jgi:Ras-like without CAAX 1
MREQYMRGGEGFILVYSVTDKRSFQEIRRYKEMIDRVRNYETVPMVIAGNKSDLEDRRQVSTNEGELMAKEFGCPFFETSAALRHNVEEIFEEVVRCIRRKENADYYAKVKAEGGKVPGGTKYSHGRVRRLFCCLSGAEDDDN